jgi:hypothetical protein
MRRLALVALPTWLLLAAPAFAGDNGEGVVGETDDRIITFFCLGLVIAFTFLQQSLDRRKEERKATELRKRVGW